MIEVGSRRDVSIPYITNEGLREPKMMETLKIRKPRGRAGGGKWTPWMSADLLVAVLGGNPGLFRNWEGDPLPLRESLENIVLTLARNGVEFKVLPDGDVLYRTLKD